MKRTPSQDHQAGYARRFLAPIRRDLHRGISAEMLAKETARLLRRPIAKTTVFRWLLNRGKPVEPKVGAALALKQAWKNLSKRVK